MLPHSPDSIIPFTDILLHNNRDNMEHKIQNRVNYLFSDTRSRTLLDGILRKLVWTYVAYSLTIPPSLSQNACLIVVLDHIKVVSRNHIFSDKIQVLSDTGQ